MYEEPLIIVGASARAAAFSAYRAGYAPYWLDQFGDTDLRQRFSGQIISAYPELAVQLIDRAPDAPFIYTGALENHPRVLEQLCRRRTLLGNAPTVCRGVRDPFRLRQLFRRQRIPCPELRRGAVADTPGDWLLKPRAGAGGSGIRRYTGETVNRGWFLQQYLRGESLAAVFVAGQDWCRLLGVTRQLVGLPEFHAGEFGYCGSIGPLEPDAAERARWDNIGAVIAAEFGLRGLFGVDAVRADGEIYPVEVNPRYTASVEALELALDAQALKLHCAACQGGPPPMAAPARRRLIGKAILFAPQDLIFSAFAPTGFTLADVPCAGAEIRQGQPLLSIVVTGTDIESISAELKQAARCVFRNSGIQQVCRR